MSKIILNNVKKAGNFSFIKRTFSEGKIYYTTGGSSRPSSTGTEVNVDGLSEACLKVPKEPVGPGAGKNTDYKNPEYFCYDKNSYFEAEVEMLKYRCPQPSTDKPFYQNN